MVMQPRAWIRNLTGPATVPHTSPIVLCASIATLLFALAQDGNTPLVLAASQGLTDLAQLLLEQGATTEATDKVRGWRVGVSFRVAARMVLGWCSWIGASS